jgi:hypothetical protein
MRTTVATEARRRRPPCSEAKGEEEAGRRGSRECREDGGVRVAAATTPRTAQGCTRRSWRP